MRSQPLERSAGKRGYERGVTRITDMKVLSTRCRVDDHQPGEPVRGTECTAPHREVLEEIPWVREELGYPPL